MNGSTSLNTTCPACRGSGLALDGDSGDFVRCPYCGGKGQVPRRFNRQHFDYAFPTAQLSSAGTPVSVPLQLDDDADFEQTGWLLFDGPAASLFPRYTIYVGNQSEGQRLLNDSTLAQTSGNTPCAGIAAVNFAGAASNKTSIAPSPLVEPYVWKAGSVLVAVFNPTTTLGLPVAAQLVMKGYKLYPLAKGQRAA